jgi:lysophospholipase L1-like esterase
MKKILMTGDSLIEFYNWQKRFPEYDIENKGIAGETVKGLLLGLPFITKYIDIPDAIIIMIGTNNLAMDDYSFMGDYREILEKFQSWYPKAHLAVTSLLPLHLPWLAPDAVKRLNASLHQVTEELGADFIDVFSDFITEESAGRILFLDDGVHLSDEGYSVWAEVLQGYFNDILP